jgi:hypothetical protein
MKANPKKKEQTFDELIAGGYDVCGKHKAMGIAWLALKAHLVEFRGQ